MYSAEGEYVPFADKVTAEGPVEVWLTMVESNMRSTLKKELVKSMVNFKRLKKDKWINETPGQLVIGSRYHYSRISVNDISNVVKLLGLTK
jgi:dynein heavy chain